MIKKIIKKYSLNDSQQKKDDRAYWLSVSPEERISAVEIMRKQMYGNSERLQRVVRVISQQQG